MKISIYAIGKYKKDLPEMDLCLDYLKRAEVMGRAFGVTGCEIREFDTKLKDANPKKESELILAAISDGAYLICLDERGKNLGSEEFAENIEKLKDNGVKEIIFAIGGAEGHSQEFKSRADLQLSFGKMTWPHKLVRAMAGEQIYRSVSIIAKTPYHKA